MIDLFSSPLLRELLPRYQKFINEELIPQEMQLLSLPFNEAEILLKLSGLPYQARVGDLRQRLLDDAVMWQGKIDQATDRALVAAWPIDRIDPVLRALFRAAGAELSTPATPPKVVINEFVDVARAFFPEGKEPKFVNAVLDHMARAFRPEAF